MMSRISQRQRQQARAAQKYSSTRHRRRQGHYDVKKRISLELLLFTPVSVSQGGIFVIRTGAVLFPSQIVSAGSAREPYECVVMICWWWKTLKVTQDLLPFLNPAWMKFLISPEQYDPFNMGHRLCTATHHTYKIMDIKQFWDNTITNKQTKKLIGIIICCTVYFLETMNICCPQSTVHLWLITTITAVILAQQTVSET